MTEPRQSPSAAGRGAEHGAGSRGEALTADSTPAGLTFAGPRAEQSAWLRGTVARRLRQIEAMRLDLDGHTSMVAPLGRPATPGSDDDRSCDRCGAFTPIGEPFYPVAVRPTPWLALVAGLCGGCADTEVSA